LAADFAEQAHWLAAEGVDLLALEMLFDVEVSRLALRAAVATGRPVMLGFTCRWGSDRRTVETRRGELSTRGPLPLAEALPAVLADAPAGARLIVAIMHADFDVTSAAIDVVQSLWRGPIAVYPNSGVYLVPHWQFDTVCAPEIFGGLAADWAARGVQIIGGCCGLGPAHVRAARVSLGLG
jgi:S-methylmethionine-dependent homocysteine/selenocysteine methylase